MNLQMVGMGSCAWWLRDATAEYGSRAICLVIGRGGGGWFAIKVGVIVPLSHLAHARLRSLVGKRDCIVKCVWMETKSGETQRKQDQRLNMTNPVFRCTDAGRPPWICLTLIATLA
jgi:hypothetical protein